VVKVCCARGVQSMLLSPLAGFKGFTSEGKKDRKEGQGGKGKEE